MMMMDKIFTYSLEQQHQIGNIINQNVYTNDSMEKGSNSFVIVKVIEMCMQIKIIILCTCLMMIQILV